ncbi:MAG: tRNA pseudouridine(38-40) synthase TruA [Paludibacteraceae bacterium]|nr:tRNA pseudouridine(38-40) synthase TruA [Paludibacteraceae bacterium]
MMRYFLLFSYVGTPFHGSQRQPTGITVQQVMEEALCTILRTPVPLTFAGRTDAGVHARLMTAHFDLDSLPDNLLPRLNSLLPDTIAIHAICPVPPEAHARFDATTRTYQYHIHWRKDPFLCGLSTRVAPGLDFDSMNRAALHLLGEKDCASFCRTHTDVKTTICHITRAEWTTSDYSAVFTITANRFLRNMVRAVVGTLLDVGRHRLTPDDFAHIIARHDRTAAGQSAPPEGLFLTDITYPYL